MWKIAVAFAVFASLALWVIAKGGDSLDMSGEKHDTGGHEVAKPAAAAASAAQPAASAAKP